jgi:hypothetical protein
MDIQTKSADRTVPDAAVAAAKIPGPVGQFILGTLAGRSAETDSDTTNAHTHYSDQPSYDHTCEH